MKGLIKVTLVFIYLFFSIKVSSQPLPQISTIPDCFSPQQQALFAPQKEVLEKQKKLLKEKVNMFNLKCEGVPESDTKTYSQCESEQSQIRIEKKQLADLINRFNVKLQSESDKATNAATTGTLIDGPFETLLMNLDSFCSVYGSGGGKVSVVKAKEGYIRLNNILKKVTCNINGNVGNANQITRAENKLDCANRALARLQVLASETVSSGQSTEPVNASDANEIVIQSMLRLAKELGWSSEKQARLAQSLNDLTVDGNNNLTLYESDQSWKSLHNRSVAELANIKGDAAKGAGPGLYASGEQGHHQDCAVFALATATGTTYGFASARAAEVISRDDYRTAAERADPTGTLSRSGLNGGEVIMVAEAFGSAQVISSDYFAKALQEGKPVMVNVHPDGTHNMKDGHEVVLSRTFQHKGQTWFEMIDSHDGSMNRQYLSLTELKNLVKERGVTYQAEPGTIVKPIH